MRRNSIPAMVGFYILVLGVLLCATFWGSVATSTIADLIPVKRDHVLVLDAGHGGEDGGAISCTGISESKLNLEITKTLNDLLHLLGYKTVMIRDADVSVYTGGKTIAEKKVSDLKERVRIVNETENGLLLSIHQNIFSDSRYSGAQVFYGLSGESVQLAEKLQTALCTTLNPNSNRKCKEADHVYLMQHINCTGVLIECGFLSNAEEEAKLNSPDYQQKLCCVIASTLSRFLTQSD